MDLEGSSWKQKLLVWFTPEIASIAPVTVLIDPDGLYQDPAILAEIEAAGFAILRFDDPLRFRLTYEREYRERWDRGERSRALVIHSALSGDALPYDLTEQVAQHEHIRTVKLGDFFDRLDPNLLLAMDRDLLGKLWEVYQEKPPQQGGFNATADYLLVHVFQLHPDTWNSDVALLSALLAHHYRGRTLPPALVARLVAQRGPRFPDWPLQALWESKLTFYRFLGERWPLYLAREIAAGQAGIGEGISTSQVLTIPGPADLPFCDKEVRVYLDTLFLEGLVDPVKDLDQRAVPADWMRLGVAPLTEADRVERFRRQTERLAAEMPTTTDTHLAWLAFGRKLGEWLAVRWRLALPPAVADEARAFHTEAEQRFATWLTARFGGLLSLPPVPVPLVVHQVAPHMAQGWEAKGRPKRALVVVDGMNWAQWTVLRRELMPVPGQQLHEGAIFAFVPSITQVSRQAIFAGDLPWGFAKTIGTTSKEDSLWRAFWEGHGALKPQVGYLLYGEGEPAPSFLGRLEELTAKPTTRIIGLVLGQVDKLTHGVAGVMSSRELQASVAAWGESGLLRQVVDHLLEAGYEVWLTADHGNIEAVGVGNPNTGNLTEERSERALVFGHANLRAATATKYPGAVEWAGAGLPDDYFPLVATGFEAFTTKDAHTLSHGGISIEEMVVPFVRMEQK